MNINDLGKLRKLEEELRELDNFLRTAKKVWTGKLTLSKIIHSSYGIFKSREYNLSTEIKNKILAILEERLDDVKKDIERL